MGRMWRMGLGVAACLFAFGAAAQSTVALKVGETTLQFPAGVGYVSARAKAPQVYESMSVAIPPSLRLVDAFYTEDDIKRSVLGLGRPDQTVFAVQVLRDAEAMSITESDWAQAKPGMATALGELDLNELNKKAVRDSSKRMSEFSGRDIDVRIGKTKRPLIYNTEGDTIRFLMILPVQGRSGSQSVDETMVAAGAIVRLREKMIYLYLFHRREDEATAPALQAQLDEFLPRLFAANAPVEAPVTPAKATAGTASERVLSAPGRASAEARMAAE